MTAEIVSKRRQASNPNRGSKPGEKRGGRQKGTPNKVSAPIREAARAFTEDALQTLVEVMADVAQPAAARVSAANAILDRGYGKPTTVVAGDEDGGAIKAITEIILRGPDAG